MLNVIKSVPEVSRIYCATANPVVVIVAETESGRGILGVVDGSSPMGIEGDEDIAWRKGFLRMIGYKLYSSLSRHFGVDIENQGHKAQNLQIRM